MDILADCSRIVGVSNSQRAEQLTSHLHLSLKTIVPVTTIVVTVYKCVKSVRRHINIDAPEHIGRQLYVL